MPTLRLTQEDSGLQWMPQLRVASVKRGLFSPVPDVERVLESEKLMRLPSKLNKSVSRGGGHHVLYLNPHEEESNLPGTRYDTTGQQ